MSVTDGMVGGRGAMERRHVRLGLVYGAVGDRPRKGSEGQERCGVRMPAEVASSERRVSCGSELTVVLRALPVRWQCVS